METAAAVAGTEVVIQDRKRIRCIAVLDFVIGFVTLVLLSNGFFPTMNPSGDKTSVVLFCIFFVKYTLQGIFAIVLFRGTNNEKNTKFPMRTFKIWFRYSTLLPADLIFEIHHILTNLEGITMLVLFTLSCCKFFFRVASMLIVYDSMENFNDRCRIPVVNAARDREETSGPNRWASQSQQAPPYETFAPPSYKDALKSVKIDIPTST